jgi:hypothetical protein
VSHVKPTVARHESSKKRPIWWRRHANVVVLVVSLTLRQRLKLLIPHLKRWQHLPLRR